MRDRKPDLTAQDISILEQMARSQSLPLKGVFLIQDGDPSHTASATHHYWAKNAGWWRPRYTPAHASWLNQAEIGIHNFRHHYLNRRSWQSREEFLERNPALPKWDILIRPAGRV